MSPNYAHPHYDVNAHLHNANAHHGPMNAKATLAKNLIRLRERAGLSQNALAKRCQGIAQSTISRIEAMEVAADVETVNTIASALGVSLWQLLSEGKTSLYPLSVKEETLIYQVRSMVDKDGTNG